jgi:hypothetical protein
MTLIDVTIEGVTPLLCNRFTDASLIGNGTSSAFKGDRGTPMEQATAKLYTNTEGKYVIPQPNLFRCIIDAGTFFKAGKSKVTTQKTSIIPAFVGIHGIELPLRHKEPWTVDSRGVVIPSTGGRIACHRPVFNDWAIDFTLEVEADQLPVKLLREIVDAAGKRIGLGDFRPARKGPFGKFAVTAWKERAAKQAA